MPILVKTITMEYFDEPYELIDLILDAFKYDKHGATSLIYISDQDLLSHAMSKMSKLDGEVFLVFHCIDLLYKEGYISKHDENKDWYRITIKGIILIKNGGYAEMKKMEKSSIERTALYDKIVVVGALIGGIYAIFEIWINILVLWFSYDFNF